MANVKEISVFVDESGSFVPEKNDPISRYYLLCMVFHDQGVDLSNDIEALEDSLKAIGLEKNHCVHAGPLIRREQVYAHMSREERRGIFQRMLAFVRRANIAYRCFMIDKHLNTKNDAIHDSLLRQIVEFLVNHAQDFDRCDKLKIYYDDGQAQVTALLKEAFAIFSSKTEFVPDVSPQKYRLFQAADLACTIELVKAKLSIEGELSSSENAFFGGEKVFKKSYLKPLERKTFI